MDNDPAFDALVQNTLLYGTGVLIMEMEDGGITTRVIPVEEYTQLGEHLKWVDQSTKETR